MNVCRSLFFILVTLLLTSCTSELTRRYKSVEMTTRGAEKPPLVRVSAFTMEVAKIENKPAILQLSAEGQASLITAVAKIEKSAEGLYQQLATGFESYSSSEVTDRSQYTVQLVFSVQKTKEMTLVADRISQLELKFEELSEFFQFKYWNKFETEYGQVDLGKIGLKQGTTFTAKATPNFGGASTGEIGVTRSKELNEEVTLRQRFITSTGVLDKHTATLVQEGVTGIDLAGNTSIDFTIELNPDMVETLSVIKFESLKNDNGYKAANELSLKRISIKAPEFSVIESLKNGVLARLTGSYIMRHVRKGDQTINEGDDEVEFIEGNLEVIPEHIAIMSKEQLERTRHRFYLHPLGYKGKNLTIDLPENSNQSLEFATFIEAEQFLEWLKNTKSTSVGASGWQLKLGNSPLVIRDIINLRIERRL